MPRQCTGTYLAKKDGSFSFHNWKITQRYFGVGNSIQPKYKNDSKWNDGTTAYYVSKFEWELAVNYKNWNPEDN